MHLKCVFFTCVMVGEPRHKVDNRLIMVETEAAVAFGSGTLEAVFVVDEAFPGVPCNPAAVDGPAAFDNRLNNSLTKPAKDCILKIRRQFRFV